MTRRICANWAPILSRNETKAAPCPSPGRSITCRSQSCCPWPKWPRNWRPARGDTPSSEAVKSRVFGCGQCRVSVAVSTRRRGAAAMPHAFGKSNIKQREVQHRFFDLGQIWHRVAYPGVRRKRVESGSPLSGQGRRPPERPRGVTCERIEGCNGGRAGPLPRRVAQMRRWQQPFMVGAGRNAAPARPFVQAAVKCSGLTCWNIPVDSSVSTTLGSIA